VSEALHNVVKHAEATTATVNIVPRVGVLLVQITDDGVGFDTAVSNPGHLGLGTMADRAASIGAELTLTSVLGAGTTASVTVPYDGLRS
jgi:signal transduction histidine kinase